MGERRATLGLAPSLPGIALVLVIVWAFVAVLLLTGTLVNAREIDKTVPLINSQVSPIDKDTKNVALAAKTAKISEQIKKSAAPLSGQAKRIITVARSIDGRVEDIRGTAESINGTVKSINGNARAINGKVRAINGNAVSINNTVNSINGDVVSINRRVTRIGGSVTSINARVGSIFRGVGPRGATDRSIKASVNRILGTFKLLNPETGSIDIGVAGINARASKGITGVRTLKDDFAPISVLVGSPFGDHNTAGPGSIHGHANSIDCSKLINFAGPTSYCGK